VFASPHKRFRPSGLPARFPAFPGGDPAFLQDDVSPTAEARLSLLARVLLLGAALRSGQTVGMRTMGVRLAPAGKPASSPGTGRMLAFAALSVAFSAWSASRSRGPSRRGAAGASAGPSLLGAPAVAPQAAGPALPGELGALPGAAQASGGAAAGHGSDAPSTASASSHSAPAAPSAAASTSDDSQAALVGAGSAWRDIEALVPPAIAALSAATLLAFLSRSGGFTGSPPTPAMLLSGLVMVAALPQPQLGRAVLSRASSTHSRAATAGAGGAAPAQRWAASALSQSAEPPVPPAPVDAVVRARLLGAASLLAAEAARCVDWELVGRAARRVQRGAARQAGLAVAAAATALSASAAFLDSSTRVAGDAPADGARALPGVGSDSPRSSQGAAAGGMAGALQWCADGVVSAARSAGLPVQLPSSADYWAEAAAVGGAGAAGAAGAGVGAATAGAAGPTLVDSGSGRDAARARALRLARAAAARLRSTRHGREELLAARCPCCGGEAARQTPYVGPCGHPACFACVAAAALEAAGGTTEGLQRAKAPACAECGDSLSALVPVYLAD